MFAVHRTGNSNISSAKEYVLNHINRQYGRAPIEEPDDAEHEDKEDKRDGQSSISKGVAHRAGENRPEGNHQGDVAGIVGKRLIWIQKLSEVCEIFLRH